jgi:hypothetical protein
MSPCPGHMTSPEQSGFHCAARSRRKFRPQQAGRHQAAREVRILAYLRMQEICQQERLRCNCRHRYDTLNLRGGDPSLRRSALPSGATSLTPRGMYNETTPSARRWGATTLLPIRSQCDPRSHPCKRSVTGIALSLDNRFTEFADRLRKRTAHSVLPIPRPRIARLDRKQYRS